MSDTDVCGLRLETVWNLSVGTVPLRRVSFDNGIEAQANRKPHMTRSLHLAWLCGATPLLFGVSIFAVWMLTYWVWLMEAGLFTLYAGLVLFAVGCIVVRYCCLALCDPTISRWRLLGTASACAGLLLAYFPAAGESCWQ